MESLLAVSATVFEIFRLKDRKTADFAHPTLGVTPFEFCDEIWHQKTRIVRGAISDSEEIMTL